MYFLTSVGSKAYAIHVGAHPVLTLGAVPIAPREAADLPED